MTVGIVAAERPVAVVGEGGLVPIAEAIVVVVDVRDQEDIVSVVGEAVSKVEPSVSRHT